MQVCDCCGKRQMFCHQDRATGISSCNCSNCGHSHKIGPDGYTYDESDCDIPEEEREEEN